jgi:hypothetical protein
MFGYVSLKDRVDAYVNSKVPEQSITQILLMTDAEKAEYRAAREKVMADLFAEIGIT